MKPIGKIELKLMNSWKQLSALQAANDRNTDTLPVKKGDTRNGYLFDKHSRNSGDSAPVEEMQGDLRNLGLIPLYRLLGR